jgi:hypothetical protein
MADLPALTSRAEELRRAAAAAEQPVAREARAAAAPPSRQTLDGAAGGLTAPMATPGTPAATPGASGTPPGPLASSTPAPALARTPAPPTPAPPPTPREDPHDSTPDDIDAAALARLTGGTLADTGQGQASVSFLGRSTDPQLPGAPSGSPATTSPTNPTRTQPDAISVDGERRPLLIDEIYDRIVKRLRRELLDDRERRGRLIGEGRW